MEPPLVSSSKRAQESAIQGEERNVQQVGFYRGSSKAA